MMTDATRVLGTAQVAREVYPASVLRVGENAFVDNVEVVGLPVVKNQKQQDALSFAILAENKLVAYISDSDFMENLAEMKPDLLFVSIGGRNVQSVAKIVSLIAPKLAIPIHWGGNIGTRDDAEIFKELVSSSVHILDIGASMTL
jgi:L-ascorbate metabolism protein UlaG (beta-lactamase superfamily)